MSLPENGRAEGSLELCLKPLGAHHLAQATQLSTAVGWPHRRDDWQKALALGQGIAACQGEYLLGTAMAWHWDKYSRIGLVIVHPEHQGQGLGWKMLQALQNNLAGRASLIATEEGIALYRRMGFREEGLIYQCQGTASITQGVEHQIRDSRRIESQDASLLCQFDAKALGINRRTMLESLIESSEGILMVRDGELVGYALCRPFGRGLVIGPVIAIKQEIARHLIQACLVKYQGEFVRIDTPDPALTEWLAQHGLATVSRVMRMARGQPLNPVGPGRCFAIASQALG